MAKEYPASWLLITSRGSWERIQKLGAWAFAEKARGRAEAVKAGDIGVVYLTQNGSGESAIGGIIRFTGTTQEAEPKILFDQLYPLRMSFEALLIPKEPIPARLLVPEMSSIRCKDAWGAYFPGQAMKLLEAGNLPTLNTVIEEEGA